MQTRTILLFGLGAAAIALWLRRSSTREAFTETLETYNAPEIPEFFLPVAQFFTEQIATVERIVTGQTRGERNNNPGNIERTTDNWQGMSADQSGDPRFIVFDAPEYGIRALGKLLKNYQAQGLNTIETIINRYAPGTENDTRAYINHVAQIMQFAPDYPLDLNDPAQLNLLVQAVITHENGRNVYAQDTINTGISLIA